jgi:hypothetical protein
MKKAKKNETRMCLRAWIKTWIAKWMTVIEFCHDCGVEQPLVWWADDQAWSEVTGEKLDNDMAGILCPECFDRRAKTKGIAFRWKPEIEYRFNPK